MTPVLCRACWSLLHPWIVRRVGVHGRAAVIDRFGAQFVVPGFVAVDLAQPVLGAVLGQPRRGSEGPDVDRIPRHVRRRGGGGHPSGGFLCRAILRDRLTKNENADPFTNAVRITVSALRKRLGEPWIIATVPGVGYRIDKVPD